MSPTDGDNAGQCPGSHFTIPKRPGKVLTTYWFGVGEGGLGLEGNQAKKNSLSFEVLFCILNCK